MKDSKIFQKIPKDSKRFQKIPKDSKIFQNIPLTWKQQAAGTQQAASAQQAAIAEKANGSSHFPLWKNQRLRGARVAWVPKKQ